MNPGCIVRCRNRDWVLMASESEDVLELRPLTGSISDSVKIHKNLSNLISYSLPFERIEPSVFPLPKADNVSDATASNLLWQASRLILREGATPFRSLGRISIRPRPYQFVPLLMALRLNPIRLFIADDVGVGKTIEALLIAKELIERGEIKRFCVLCPPYLCEQWAKEIEEKFNLKPVIIRSGTINQLERQVPPGKTIYQHFPIQVASIDFIKTERNRFQFLNFCPEMVIVDEVHGAAQSSSKSQHERHELLRDIAKNKERHLILLTATPHSGIEDAFRSLLGLLRPEFAQWNISELDEKQRNELARHYVQRTRKDILSTWESVVSFPKRVAIDETYELSPNYRKLFERTFQFCSEIIQTGQRLEERKRRVRYWGALALLRCVMSSPASALVTIRNRGLAISEEEETEFKPYIFESDQDLTEDESPNPPVDAADFTFNENERRRLRELASLAEKLHEPQEDLKLIRAFEIAQKLIKEGFNPIVWCRYVATAEYVAKYFIRQLPQDIQVICITGRISDEERRAKIEEIDSESPRILVATDCLSEGINLQEKFNAVIHYDLPWNPNRLEQREGRVDRYGQPSEYVKTVRFFGRDNPVDGVVIDVLLNKARQIHDTLGTYVPVPEEGESVIEALLQALFIRGLKIVQKQLMLDFGQKGIKELHTRWQRDVEREKISRTKFAQRAIKPEEVQRELEETDSVLGDPEAVRSFVLEACSRLGISIKPDKKNGIYVINTSQEALLTVPKHIRNSITKTKKDRWLISFQSPTPEGAEYIGRNHPFVAALASYLFEEALSGSKKAIASRAGVICSRSVNTLTVLLLLRVRYLIEQPMARQLLAEEVLVIGYKRENNNFILIPYDEALMLLNNAKPDANLPLPKKQELIIKELEILESWNQTQTNWGNSNSLLLSVRTRIDERAKKLEESHKRIRQSLAMHIRGFKVNPQFPPDLLGILIIQPVVKL